MQTNKFVNDVINTFKSPMAMGDTLSIPSVADTIILDNGWHFGSANISVTAPDGKRTWLTRNENEVCSYILTKKGTYIVRYNGVGNKNFPLPDTDYYSIRFEIAVVENQEELPKWKITDVINCVLDVGEAHRVGVQPKYHLNDAQAAEFSNIEAPEFAFTRMTLREALDQIGGFIHGMARLKGNEIYYDMLGGTEQAALAGLDKNGKPYPYITNKYRQNIESYATQLDANVDNLVNVVDGDEGVMTEPYIGGYKTVRSEEVYARITDGNMVISTKYPIYSIEKLEVGPLPDGSTGDITPYVFEAAEYGTMSSFEGSYPYSKAFAIYYIQGAKNIKGLSFKSPNVISGALSKYAIANIIEAVTGYNITPDWWSTIVNQEEVSQNYPKLSFRITYTPIFSARVQQHKFYYKDMKHPRTLAYNQSANLVESRFFGENMKGAIARTGSVENIRTYRLSNLSLMPKVGQLWGDDYYVSGVTVAILPLYINVTVELSKDFNRLSQYIGINSSRRFYEVSEKQAVARDIAYADYCVIGDEEESDGLALITGYGVDRIMDAFTGYNKIGPVSLVNVKTYSESGEELQAVSLPVISTAFGNSITLSFEMEDNYSAGAKSVYNSSNGVSGYWQTDVPYCDYYGRFHGMGFYMYLRGSSPTEFGDDMGFDFPSGEYRPSPNLSVINADYLNGYRYLIVDKNSTEIIRMNYIIHFVCNRKSIILGPGFMHNSTLVKTLKSDRNVGLYALQNKLSKFATKIDLSNAELVLDYNENRDKIDFIDNHSPEKGFYFEKIQSSVDGDAWAIADNTTGELLIGANEPVTSGEDIDLPYFTFKHNIYSEE